MIDQPNEKNAYSDAEKARKKALFLDHLAQGWTVTKAAAAADLGQVTPYRWRQADPEFARDWELAVEAGTDRLEDEAYRRAVEGVEETAYYNGQPVGVVRRYSDNLLTLLLRGRRPHKYRERSATEFSFGGPLAPDRGGKEIADILQQIEDLVRENGRLKEQQAEGKKEGGAT